jgi:excisionase family DNA binding protein
LKLKQYLTVGEAAEYTGISRSQLAKLRHNGRGCPYIRVGDSPTKAIIRYRKSDLDQWLQTNMIQTTGGM